MPSLATVSWYWGMQGLWIYILPQISALCSLSALVPSPTAEAEWLCFCFLSLCGDKGWLFSEGGCKCHHPSVVPCDFCMNKELTSQLLITLVSPLPALHIYNWLVFTLQISLNPNHYLLSEQEYQWLGYFGSNSVSFTKDLIYLVLVSFC